MSRITSDSWSSPLEESKISKKGRKSYTRLVNGTEKRKFFGFKDLALSSSSMMIPTPNVSIPEHLPEDALTLLPS